MSLVNVGRRSGFGRAPRTGQRQRHTKRQGAEAHRRRPQPYLSHYVLLSDQSELIQL